MYSYNRNINEEPDKPTGLTHMAVGRAAAVPVRHYSTATNHEHERIFESVPNVIYNNKHVRIFDSCSVTLPFRQLVSGKRIIQVQFKCC